MKKQGFLIAIVLLVFVHSCRKTIDVNYQPTSFRELSKNFGNIPDAYKTVPFWAWNETVSKEMIDESLTDFANKGFGGVFIHPRYGLKTEYASEEWYEMVAYANKKAKKLNLNIWIYDENSFPSGFAGGLVPAEMPSSYNEGHALRLQHQTLLQPDSAKEYLMVYALGDSAVDISNKVEAYMGNKGNFLLFEKVYFPVNEWYAGFSYVDLIKPGVTEKFIEVTMKGYEKTVGADFGKSIPGVFTDEPNIAPQGDGPLIRWTPDLFERFYERWHYRLEAHLLSLVENSPMSNQVRHNYYQLLLELFIDRWSIPWHEYTERNNLLWTGHYWEHGWPSPVHGSDNMAMYAWHQIPGIDMLFNSQEERPDQFGNIRAVRELNSVANQLGMVRKLSETYGGSGWELSFEDMKRSGDWEYVLGVNLMNQHLSYQSLLGDRKHDFPQSFSYHDPYWEEYHTLNEYFGRLSLALASGEQINRTLVLEPTTSAWMKYSPHPANNDLSDINSEFTKLLSLLDAEQIEYDLGSENIIRDHGRVEDELFVIGQRKYNYVVLPRYLTNLNSETAGLLEQYLKQGGIIVALCQAPEFIDGKASDICKEWIRDYPEQWYTLGSCNDPRLINYLRTDDLVMVEQEGGLLFHMRRQLDDGQLLFLVNSDKNERCWLRMNIQGQDMVQLDPFNGRIESYPCVLANEILSFDADIEPGGSLLLFISGKDIKGKKQRLSKWNGASVQLPIGDIEVTLLQENALNLDYCSLLLGGDTIDLDYFYSQQGRIYQYHGFARNPWVSATQYKTTINDRDTFPEGTGFTARYPFFTDSEFSSANLQLVVERPHLYTVMLNGDTLQQNRNDWWLDKGFGVFRISGKINPGDNLIEISANPMSVYCELEPVYLIGDFDVLPLDRGWLLSSSNKKSVGSWKKQGLPFYSGQVAYTSTFEMESTDPVRLRLPEWLGTVAMVEVNGKEAGQIFMKPYELRIDEFVKKGSNTIKVTVTGSLKNLLGPHHNVSQRGIVTPWSFKYAPVVQPSGVKYDLLDYGLFKPFEIEVLN